MPRRRKDATDKPHKNKLAREFLLKSDSQLGQHTSYPPTEIYSTTSLKRIRILMF